MKNRIAKIACRTCGELKYPPEFRGCPGGHCGRVKDCKVCEYRSGRNRTRTRTLAAVKAGRLARGPCEVCGRTTRVDAHHEDYSDHLRVRWLCRKHHLQHHAALRRPALPQNPTD